MGNKCFASSRNVSPSSSFNDKNYDDNIPRIQQANSYPLTVNIQIDNEVLASYKNYKYYAGRLGAKKVAVKQNSDHGNKEFEILGNLQHPNILQHLLPPSQVDQKHVMVTEVFDTTLSKAVKEIDDVKSLMIQLANAVYYLNDHGIIHLDIAPQNIFLVTLGFENIVKLGNFENSQRGLEVKVSNHKALTEGFKAPEIITRYTAYPQSCLWSLGSVYFFMVTQGLRLYEMNSSAEQRNLPRLNATIEDTSSDNFLIKDLLTRILKENPLNRLSARDIVDHPYFWDTKQILNFIVDVSKAIETPNVFHKEILKGQRRVIGDDWTVKVDQELLLEIRKIQKEHKQRNKSSLSDTEGDNLHGKNVAKLITTIRNMTCHARSAEIVKIVGEDDDSFLDYWLSRFPALIMHSYLAMERYYK